MPFATNANYTSAVNPSDVGQPTKVVPPDLPNGFKPEGSVSAEHVNYCLNRLCPDVQTFTSNGTWTKPTGAVLIDVVLVGGGAKGEDGISGAGGAGGQAGEITRVSFAASQLGSSVSVVVGAGGTSESGRTGGASYIHQVGITAAFAAGGAGVTGNGVPPDVTYTDVFGSYNGADGGAGGTAAAGSKGKLTRYGGFGGLGGTTGVAGVGGGGYGSGGGGGRNNGGSSAGGGGGGGGFGSSPQASNGSTTTGGNGAQGVVIITTWRDIS